jgi:hypothetical protein
METKMKTLSTIRALAVLALGSSFAAPAGADEYARWIDINNNSDRYVYSVRISDVGTDAWGPDLLGAEMIEPGYYMRVEPRRHRGYCLFDVRVEYDDGQREFFWGVNLCESTDLDV